VIGLVVLVLGSAFFALTNTILNVSPPRLGENQAAINANALKPAACAGISLDSVTEIASERDPHSLELYPLKRSCTYAKTCRRCE
jgi:hypothetical protein